MGIVSKTPTAAVPQFFSQPPPVVIREVPSTTVTPAAEEKFEQEVQTEARTDNLLRRSRGRLGTILTGFRGFLDPTEQAQSSGRKTLLGE